MFHQQGAGPEKVDKSYRALQRPRPALEDADALGAQAENAKKVTPEILRLALLVRVFGVFPLELDGLFLISALFSMPPL
jgi:hypothetical protein